MTNINLITCKCGKESTACLETQTDTNIMWNCFTCGYHSSDVMKADSELVKSVEETQPELIRQSKFIDDNNNVWYPKCIVTNKHMLFCDGNNKDNWVWTVVPLEEGEVKLPNGETKLTNKPNFKDAKQYSRYDYMDALEAINFFTTNEN